MATTRTQTTTPRIVHNTTKVTTSSTAESQLFRSRDVRETHESTHGNAVSTVQISGTSTLPASRTIHPTHVGAELSNTTEGSLTSTADITIHPTQVGAVSSNTTKRTLTLPAARPVHITHGGAELSSTTNRILTSLAGRKLHGASTAEAPPRTTTGTLTSSTRRWVPVHQRVVPVDEQGNCLCQNGGSCHMSMEVGGGMDCMCPSGTEGFLCESKSGRCCNVPVWGFFAISTGRPAIVGYYLMLCWMKRAPLSRLCC